MNRMTIAVAIVAGLAAACAGGHVTVPVTTRAQLYHAAEPAFANVQLTLVDGQLLGSTRSRVEVVSATGPGGCVDTFTRGHSHRWCPLIQGLAEGEAQLYRALGGPDAFAVRISDGRIVVDHEGAEASVVIPDDPAASALRTRPELAGAMFAEHYLPGGLSRLDGPLFIAPDDPPNAIVRRQHE